MIVDAVVYKRNRVRVRDGNFTELSLTYGEPMCSVFHGRQDYWGGPIALERLDEFNSEPLVHFLLDGYTTLWTDMIRL